MRYSVSDLQILTNRAIITPNIFIREQRLDECPSLPPFKMHVAKALKKIPSSPVQKIVSWLIYVANLVLHIIL